MEHVFRVFVHIVREHSGFPIIPWPDLLSHFSSIPVEKPPCPRVKRMTSERLGDLFLTIASPLERF